MDIQTLIKDEVHKIEDKYLKSANEIVGAFHGEEQLRKDYAGRQIYELLQNADDEAENLSDGGEVAISYCNGVLSIKNTGEPFSFKGIKSLMYPNSSPKKIHKNKIGCKGLGFRSVLNWSSEIKIKTKEFCVLFSREYAKEFYRNIIQKNSALLKEITELTVEEYPIALLSCPKCLDTELLQKEDFYVTEIELRCNTESQNIIKKEIEELSFEELLFLKNLRRIKISTQDQDREIEKVVDGDIVYLNETNLRTKETKEQLWTIYKKKGLLLLDDIEKKYEFIIACPEKDIGRNNVLYSYFKTDIKMPYPALIHGTFELTSDRNNLQKGKDSNNGILIDLLIDFMIETAINIAKKSKVCDYSPLKLLTSDGTSYVLDEYFDFSKKLQDKLTKAEILPTISEKYISIQDKPKYSNIRFDCLVNPDNFPNLLKGTDDNNIKNFLRNLLGYYAFYDCKDFLSEINEDLDYYDTATKAKLIYEFKQQYKDASECPYLLVDSYGRNIIDKRKVFLFDSKDESLNIPSWVNVSFIHREMLGMLKDYFNCTNRELAEKLKAFNVVEYNFGTIYHSIKDQINKENLTIGECRNVLQWLFSYYKKNKGKEFTDSINVKVITRDNLIVDSRKAYYGKEYDNKIGENVLGVYTSNFIAEEKTLGLPENKKEEVENFLAWLGVRKFPRCHLIELEGYQNKNKYWEYQFDTKEYVYCGQDTYRKNSYFEISKILVNQFENLEEIITRAKFEDVLLWMMTDSRFKAIQEAGDAEAWRGAKIVGKGYSQRNYRETSYCGMRSYILWRIKETEWVQTDGKKVRPLDCCFKNDDLKDLIYKPVIDYTYLKEQGSLYNRKQIEGLLNFLGVANVFYEMDKRQIYKVLLALPEYDEKCNLGKRMYESLIDNIGSIDKLISDNEVYDYFRQKGHVLSKTKEGRKYVPIHEVYYSDKRLYGAEVLNNFNIFDCSMRSGEQKIEKLFGVKPLKNIKLTIEHVNYQIVNDKFQNVYNQFLPYVYARRMRFKNAEMDYRNLRKTKVFLCDEVRFSYIVEKKKYSADLNDYESILLKEKKQAYIKVPYDLYDLEVLSGKIEFASAVADVLEQILDIGGDGSFYRDLFLKSTRDRDYTLQHDCGDENLQYLMEARKKFGSESTQEEEFWRVMADLLDVSYEDYAEIKEKVWVKYAIDEELKPFNCVDLKSLENVEKLIAFFNSLGITLVDYNQKSAYTIDISAYWKQKWIEMKQSIKMKYISYLCQRVYAKTLSIVQFKDLKDEYNFNDRDFENSVTVNLKAIFQDEYKVPLQMLESIDLIDFEKKLKNIQQERSIDYKLYEEDRDIVDIAFTFEREDELQIRTVDPMEEKEIFDARKSAEIFTGGTYSVEDTSIERVDNIAVSTKERSVKKYSGQHTSESQTQKDTNGINAELAVYDYLKSRFDEVQWMSSYAAQAGINSAASDMFHYDIQYCNEAGEIVYVEVKSVQNHLNIEFKMSQAELQFAQEHCKNYEIYVVQHADKKIRSLGKIFDFDDTEILWDNSKFSIQADAFVLKAKIKG